MKKIIICFLTILLISGCKKDSKEYTLMLEGNPTTGYNWTYDIEDPTLVDIIEEYITNCEENVVGCGGTYTYTITGLKNGKTNIKFNYKREWEITEYDLDATYEIEVKNKKVTLTKKEGSYFDKNNY